MGPRPAAAAAAATPAVRTVPQYKYAAGVRNPQQHLSTQPQVAMQQVSIAGAPGFAICKHYVLKGLRKLKGFEISRSLQAG